MAKVPTKAEVAAVSRVVRTFAISWILSMWISVGGLPILVPIGFLVAFNGWTLSRRIVTDGSVRRDVTVYWTLWVATIGFWISSLATGSTAPRLAVIVLVGLLPVVGMRAVAQFVQRTEPPPDVIRWTAIGEVGSLCLAGISLFSAGATSQNAEFFNNPGAAPWWVAAPAISAVVALMLGYCSASGHLMRSSSEDLFPMPRQWPG